MKYLLDTNACIRILKGDSPKMLVHIKQAAKEEICISTVVRFELFYGIYKSKNTESNIKNLNIFLQSVNTLYFDEHASQEAGRVRFALEESGTPIGPYDLLIGATALAYDCTLITHNTKEFSRIKNLRIEDWEVE